MLTIHNKQQTKATEISTFKRQFQNAQQALNQQIRDCYTYTKRTAKFNSKSTTVDDLALVFASTSSVNFVAAFALPLVVAFQINDIVSPRKDEPFVCMQERKLVVQFLARLCRLIVVLFVDLRNSYERIQNENRSVNAMLRIGKDFIYANWCEQIVPTAFRKRPEIKFLRFAKQQLNVFVCKEQLRVNRKTKRIESPTFRFTIENVMQLRNNPGKTQDEQDFRADMLQQIYDAFADRLIDF